MHQRVLVIDDYQPWRRYICSTLEKSSRWQVVGEGSDGVEAVEKARLLRPDLILLDVTLPRRNGFEAAREILTLRPDSRILFVSQHHSLDIVEAALATGARGFVLKGDAGHELRPAMQAIARGGRFISARLTGRVLDAEKRSATLSRNHEAGFYRNDTAIVAELARFAAGALAAGKSVIVAAIPSHRAKLHQKLLARGIKVDHCIEQRRFISVDVAETLATFMVDGWPDERLFWNASNALIWGAARAASGELRVAACGECAPALWKEGKRAAAIRVEKYWDEIARTYNCDVLCTYPSLGSRHDEVVKRICAQHSVVHW